MIKLQHFEVDKVEPSVNRQRGINFHIVDTYVCKEAVRAIDTIGLEKCLDDSWVQEECKTYLKEHGLQLCNLYMSDGIRISTIIVDENVKELIETL